MTAMHTSRFDGAVCRLVALLAILGSGCGKVGGPHSSPADATEVADASAEDARVDDAARVDGPPVDALPGSRDNPARTCAELKLAGMASGVYWMLPPSGVGATFEVYCEQTINGGGWAMVLNSVRRADGTTAAFWQFKYADRLKLLGTAAPDQNYYNGSLYVIGKEYMDVIVDLQDKLVIAALMTATGINVTTMRFTAPTFMTGNLQVFNGQFAAGWSSQDFKGDDAPGVNNNCSKLYNNIAQHYANCWAYSLGSDFEDPRADGGVGPHVINVVLTALGLASQTNGGVYSQVKRIARFTRW